MKEVRDQHGEWGIAGQTRTVLLSPTGSFHEELTRLDPPHSFGYALTGITGPLGLLIGRAEGEWTFVPSGTATTITWSWNIHAASRLAAPLLPVLGQVWKGYARQSLATLVGRADPLMCRLFGLHAGTNVVTATFWLLDAPDNLSEQSRRNPDGSGLGVFDAQGRPQVHKQPIAAWEDTEFATEAHDLTGTTFVAHVRYATTGSHDVVNTHPFLQDGRIFAHNGVVEGLDVLDERLRELGTADLVLGQTDSERVFALITASIRARGGDVRAGLVDALVGWPTNVPIYAVNMLLSTATDLWALRYPESQRAVRLGSSQDSAGSPISSAHQPYSRGQRPSAVHSRRWCSPPSGWTTIRRWRLLEPGELVHVDSALQISRDLVLPDPPRHQLRPADLNAAAQVSQHSDVEVTSKRALVLGRRWGRRESLGRQAF